MAGILSRKFFSDVQFPAFFRGQSKPIFITEIILLLFPFEIYVSKTVAHIYGLLVLNYSLSFAQFQVPSCWIIFDCTYASSVVVIYNRTYSRPFLPPQKDNHLPYYKLYMCYTIATRWVLVRNKQQMSYKKVMLTLRKGREVE